MSSAQYVILNVHDQNLAIGIEQVNEIISVPQIFKVPNSPDYVEGLISLRGKVYTVINLCKKFKLPVKDADENTKIVIVNSTSASIGLLVDNVKEIAAFDDSDIESSSDSVATKSVNFIKGVAKKDDVVTIILDVEKLIAAS